VKKTFTTILMLAGMFSLHANAGVYDTALNDVANNKIKTWANSAVIVAAVKAQNTKNSGLSQDDIVKLDKKWRAETKGSNRPMIDEVMSNEMSAHLKGIKESGQGLYTEIFVMDNRGLNVGQSDVTSDYWQGDEAKWQKTYSAGAEAVHIGKIEKDESTQQFQAQVSVSIVDPTTKKPIGAVTVGVNADEL